MSVMVSVGKTPGGARQDWRVSTLMSRVGAAKLLKGGVERVLLQM